MKKYVFYHLQATFIFPTGLCTLSGVTIRGACSDDLCWLILTGSSAKLVSMNSVKTSARFMAEINTFTPDV